MNMWTRSELKERGKAALHRNYWIVVLATLVVTALTGGTELVMQQGMVPCRKEVI